MPNNERQAERTEQKLDSAALSAMANAMMTLSASLDRRQDADLGAGYCLNVTGEVESHRSQLEFYPAQSTARYQGPNLKIELTGISSIQSDDEGLHLGAESLAGQVDLTIVRGGIVRLGIIPSIGPRDLPAGTGSYPTDESQPKADNRAPGNRSEIGGKEKAKEPRVNLTGRVGTDVFLRKTNAGKFVASFPLATRTVDKKTVWTTVVAFDKRAEALKENVAKRQQAQVVGYKHVVDRKMKDGSTKQVEEVYAVVVKPVRPDDAGTDKQGG